MVKILFAIFFIFLQKAVMMTSLRYAMTIFSSHNSYIMHMHLVRYAFGRLDPGSCLGISWWERATPPMFATTMPTSDERRPYDNL